MAEATPALSATLPEVRHYEVARRILAGLVGLAFLYAGLAKVADPLRFASDISNYQIVSWPIAVRMAFYLPWLELVLGFALIFRRLFAGALALTTTLMIIFIGASIQAKARGIDLSCGCFGSLGNNLSFTSHLLIDFALLGSLLLVAWWPLRKIRPA